MDTKDLSKEKLRLLIKSEKHNIKYWTKRKEQILREKQEEIKYCNYRIKSSKDVLMNCEKIMKDNLKQAKKIQK